MKDDELFSNLASEGIVIHVEGVAKKVNPAFCRLFGYSEEELIGQNLIQLLVEPKSIDLTTEREKRINPKPYFVNGIKKDGSIIPVKLISQEKYLENNEKIRVVLVTEDLLIHSERQEALIQSEKRLESLSNLTSEGIIIHENGFAKDVNKTLLKMFGYTREECIGVNMIELLAPEEYREYVYSRMRSSEYLPYEVEGLKKDGTRFPAEIEAKEFIKDGINYRAVAIRDLSEQKRKETEMSGQKLLFETMFNAIQDGIIFADCDRNILLVNRAFEKIFGYSQSELTGKSAAVVYADLKCFNKAGIQVYNENSETKNLLFKMDYKTKSGRTFLGETFGTKLYNAEGEWIGNFGIIRDISEREEMIEALKIAKDRAEESDILKSQFLANMSHEIRTPMNGIVGFSQLLKKDNIDETKKNNYIDIIVNSSTQLLRIIDDILEVSRLETNQLSLIETEVCINDVLVEQLNIFTDASQKRDVQIFLKKGLNDDESRIKTDSSKLQKILSNLIENALKFTSDGFIEIGYILKDNFLEFYVKDTGIGVLPALQDKIFDRFSQANEKIASMYGGLGLGLSIVKENVEILGGKIILKSEENVGSNFIFTVPYKQIDLIQNPAPIKESTKKRPMKSHPATILIAEDEVINYLYLESLFHELNPEFTVLHARNGLMAVEMVVKNPKISVVFMDIKMPKLNGYDALKIIKKSRPKLIVIAQTGFSTEEEKNRAKQAGFDSLITKPIYEHTIKELLIKHSLLFDD